MKWKFISFNIEDDNIDNTGRPRTHLHARAHPNITRVVFQGKYLELLVFQGKSPKATHVSLYVDKLSGGVREEGEGERGGGQMHGDVESQWGRG